ncbi:MAG: TonB-dependent receptor [Deferribacterales bacterium]|nr:TonB-dependent receptor [Deferribacterales bacterium]
MKKFLAALLVAVAPTALALAQDAVSVSSQDSSEEIVVTGSRIPVSAAKAGPGVTVITREQIDRIKPNTFSDILRTVPGFTVVDNGAGKVPSIYIRGGNSGMTAIFIDGVPLYDSSNIESIIDFASIPVDNIEKVEIVKGPVSASMGGGSMNGAINIITKKDTDKILNADVNFGSALGPLHYKGDARVYGANDTVNYMVSGSYRYDEGVSSAARKYGNNEKDEDALGSLSARFGVTPFDDFSSQIFLNYTNMRSDTDDGGGAGMDNPDYLTHIKRYFLSWETKYLFNDIWEPSLKVHFTNQERHYGPASQVFASNGDYYLGRTVGVDFQNNFYVMDELAFTAGASFGYDEAEVPTTDPITWAPAGTYKASEESYSGYAQANIYLFDAWTTIFAVRGDKYGDNDFEPTYRVSTVYDIKSIDFQIKGAVGTGYKSPSLYQTFDPTYGNKDLNPQKSVSYEAGVSNGLFDRFIVWEATWFENWYDDLISWDWNTSRYKNTDSAHTRGVEAVLSVYPFSWLDINGSYMFLEAFDQNREPMLRRPKHQGGVSATVRPVEGLSIFVEALFRGKAPASPYDASPWVSGYEILNATVSYDVREDMQIWLKGENLTDRQYEEIAGYGTKGIEVMLGLKMKI